MTLLRYCLSDVVDDDAESVAALDGVPLVPLADGTCGVFRRSGIDAPPLYAPTAEEVPLLSLAKDAAVDRDAGRDDAVAIGRVGDDARVERDAARRRRARGAHAAHLTQGVALR